MLDTNSIKELIKIGVSIDELKIRRTGRSLSYALNTISESLKNPGKPIKINDHIKEKISIKHIQVPIILNIIEKLNLQYFQINPQDLTITFTFNIDKIIDEALLEIKYEQT